MKVQSTIFLYQCTTTLLSAVLSILLMIVTPSSSSAQRIIFPGGDPNDIIGTLRGRMDDFSLLLEALRITNLIEVLQVPLGPYTMLAPSNNAFASLPDGWVQTLLMTDEEGSDWLFLDILLYHVIPGRLDSSTLLLLDDDGMEVGTLSAGQSLTLSTVVNGTTVVLNDEEASIVEADISATNGLIHILDNVLVPPSVMDFMMTVNTTNNSTTVIDAQ